MKQCSWCEHAMKKQNFKRHQKTCILKVEIGLSKSEIEKLKGENKQEEEKDNVKIEIDNVEMRTFLEDIYKKSVSLHKKIIIESKRNPFEKIDRMNVGESTKKNYLREWKLYTRWLKLRKQPIGKDSAESYLSTLKCRASTKRQKYLSLQLLLQHIVDPSIKLEKIRWRISFIPKYALTTKELHDYLKEQKKLDSEDYLVQKLMAIYGLRVNTCASLKLKHLEFRYREPDDLDKRIHLPDSKVKTVRVEPIDSALMKLLDDHIKKTIKDTDNEEEYIFLRDDVDLREDKRAYMLALRINRRIRKSKALKKFHGYKYSSHMFRKTKAYNMYQSGVSALKEIVRKSIGQASGSNAVEPYIN